MALLFLGLILQLFVVFPAPAQARQPNVLVVLTDDQGFGDVQSHGNRWIKTPCQDRLAESGARFDRFFVSPVCAPTRASLLTGRWHLRTGVHGVTRGYETMRSGETTFAELFRDAGYATAAFGKWHNGAHFPEHPRGQGFQTFTGFCSGHFNNYFDAVLERDGEAFTAPGFMIDRLTDYAIDFIDGHQEQPWLCYVAYNTPHTPWQVPDDDWNRARNLPESIDLQARCAFAMVENIDTNLGRLLDAIDQRGLEEDTIVVFLTDNGANSDRYNAGMRGRKGSLHEGGTRVPCFVRWTGTIASGKQIESIAAHIDLLPTLCELADVPVPPSLAIDGQSLVPLLGRSPDATTPDSATTVTTDRHANRKLFAHWGDGPDGLPLTNRGAVRTARYRAVLEQGTWQLYDMVRDPSQETDLAATLPEKTQELAAAYRTWFADVTSGGFERIPILVDVERDEAVVLPAHEADLHAGPTGGISYQGQAGWANDWITGWTDAAAFATWDLRVAGPGEFEVAVYYAANAVQTRNVIRVATDGRGQPSVAAMLATPALAEQLPSPDRIPRKEVHERAWGRKSMGRLRLPTGQQRLRVEAVTLASESLCEVKALELRPVE